ncbi:Glutathione import ATP-binding protein GsiA [Marinomonas spartinae]|uniref:Glutathione import ATP-binding protein GsiA n=1 Tax=Marinomonas spartinae TaxID=1792290 RepID=A0A1A8T884_9GAMM|nr:ABC transporter ATP-binding protein [Marinomonas spartinae]SBS27498.1 Glutathione import ATP-binding protein GsiA [Marinomonas spartinae]SBS29883.1 Glutathione import ATP-binding protein GsiA [Marinomonas spartinae]
MKTPLVRISNLKIDFKMEDGRYFEALKRISFDIPHHTVLALVGESGSGKSVTSTALMGLLPESNTVIDQDSCIEFNGRSVLAMSKKELRRLRGGDIAMIFQDPMSSLNPVFTIGDQIIETLQEHKSMSKKAARQKAIDLLTEVGLPNPESRIHAYPHELSGGQQQRVMIAIAIACEPKLLIADEPTTALDVTIQKQILELIAKMQKKHGMSVLFVTHDLGVVAEFADNVVVMRHGEICESGGIEEVFSRPKHPYTKALLNCRPSLTYRPERLAVIDDFLQGEEYQLPADRPRGYQEGNPVILEVKNLCKYFKIKTGLFRYIDLKAVDGVSFQLQRGKTLGIVGESGSGKSTVGHTIMRLLESTSGEALFEGKDILSMSNEDFKPLKRRVQIIFQNPYASLNPRFTVGQILIEPMLLHHIGKDKQEREKLARSLLDKVGLTANAFNKYPHEFSGGQRQRIAIARCLTLQPDILICDESVSALDVSVQAQVLNLLQDLQDEFQMSYLFISHDLSVVKHISDQIMVMQQGKVVEMGDADSVYANPQHDYTQKLIASIPQNPKWFEASLAR